MLNRVEGDVQISAGNEDTEHSLWGWSLHSFNGLFVNNNVVGKINADKVRFDFW